MKYKVKIITSSICIATFFIGHSLFAQGFSTQFSPLGKLAQDYILRLNEELKDTNNIVPTSKQNPVVVNPEAIMLDAIAESISTISKTAEEIQVEKQRVITDIKESIKNDIDASIIEIKTRVEKPAFELQKSIDLERTELFENITSQIEKIRPIETAEEIEKIEILKAEIDTSIDVIQKNLENESGVSVNFEKSKSYIDSTLLKFQQVLEEKKDIVESRSGELVFKDTDEDGVSDYDEIYLYKTDPENSRTKGEGKTDGEKIREGINPLSDSEEKIAYQDPREDKESYVSSSYRVDKVQLIKDEKKLVFEGIALPNTYITLYIYSTPIIVTVRTDENGQWTYELEKEIENGEHQIYVASVESSGKIIARSNPILFTKSAEAATIGIAGSIDNSLNTQNFLKDNFILITLATLIGVVILGMMFVGEHKTVGSAVSELKKQINS